MTQLRQDYSKFVKQDAEILVIGPESSDRFKAYWEANNLPFTGLPDPEHRVLKIFGQEVNLFKLGRMPAQVMVDKCGIARFIHYGKSMSDIPTNQEILDLLAEMNQIS
jgi:peroxiredoxin Q/BCP